MSDCPLLMDMAHRSECLDANCSLALPRGVRMGPDARGGDVAHATVVHANLAREIGLWQKQSSLWFQARMRSEDNGRAISI